MFRNTLFSSTLVFFLIAFNSVSAIAQRVDRSGAASDEVRIFDLINHERERAGLGSLRLSGRLSDFARTYSRQMARDGLFDHIDRDGNSVVERADQYRISGWSKLGENLFYCEPTNQLAGFAVRGWMQSAIHRRNILDPDWSATGIGIAVSRTGEIYITEVFAAS